MGTTLTSESSFRWIVKTILSASAADDTFISFRDTDSTTLRFANNQVVQHVSVRSPRVSIRVAFGRRAGGVSTNRLDSTSLRIAVEEAQRIARLAPSDPEYLPPLPRQRYADFPTFHDATAAVTPMDLADRTKPVIERCMRHALVGAGIMSNRVTARGVAASTGLFGYELATEGRFSLTASGNDSSGWTLNAHRDMNALEVGPRANRAVEKAILSASPRELPAGHYPVILEPAAVAGLFGPFFRAANAKSYYRGNSALAGKLDSAVLDPRLTVRDDPGHPDLLGSRFGRGGLPSQATTWIEGGVLKQLYYDRFTAKEHGVEPTPRPSAPIMSFDGPTVDTIDTLIAQTERAVLITNFWYIRSVDPSDLTITGMTRDGTFLVEEGRIVGGLRNFRFHDSPLRCLQRVEAATPPMESITLERGKMLLPALRLPDFHLSSVTQF